MADDSGHGHDTRNYRLRSNAWFTRQDRDGFGRRSWMKNQGRVDHLFDGRPVIGICNTWSEFTPCNGHFRQIARPTPVAPRAPSGSRPTLSPTLSPTHS